MKGVRWPQSQALRREPGTEARGWVLDTYFMVPVSRPQQIRLSYSNEIVATNMGVLSGLPRGGGAKRTLPLKAMVGVEPGKFGP